VSASMALPIKTHIKNAGLSLSKILAQLNNQEDLGFDAETKNVVDLKERGILDPVTITTRALQIAFGRAREVLQTGAWNITKPNPILPAGPRSRSTPEL
jgi:chaperonin GroEL (HSP60 family)